MNETEFFERRESAWQQLAQACDRAESSPQHLNNHDLEQFVRLYREVSGDLARVQAEGTNQDLEGFLNQLVGRAYGILYRRRRQRVGPTVLRAIATAAQTVRRRAGFIAVAVAFFLAGTTFGAAVLGLRPDLRVYLVPPGMEPVFESWRTGQHDPKTGSDSLGMMGFYASNNPRVAITAASVAAGTFGVGTAYILWSNGVLLGSLGQDVARVGHLDHLLVSIGPHGASELTGIMISGASGLLLGAALVFPGRRTRGQALRENGRDALTLMVLAAVMMFIAAPFEAFFSFNPEVPDGAKAVVTVLVFGAWIAFFTSYGRHRTNG